MPKSTILPGYWSDRLKVNQKAAIFHQWEQLEASGCIENFRIATGEMEGFREGWFFADSDAFKWLDAAARIYATNADQRLADLMDDFIELISRTQEPDGYLFTYNQILFPGSRWTNLQIEHELYCHGHLIEAGVSHNEATGRHDLLDIARLAADRIVADFRGKGAECTPGHQEIEIALLRLFETTKKDDYLEIARQFIEQRGRHGSFWLSVFMQNNNVGKRDKSVRQRKQGYLATHPGYTPKKFPIGNYAKKPWSATLRWMLSGLNGKYFQQHTPVRKQSIPVGHSVRFAYLETAIAMLARMGANRSFTPALEQAWDRMISRRMYVTGGIGSLPALEGFGNDYELDPEIAYAETCAALACMFWNWEMVLVTGKARYSDLFEWQLYNASNVGMGIDGKSYFYNNPLACRGGVTRQAWFAIPCCPSNISRTWADLRKYLYTHDEGNIWVHQYISNETEFEQIDHFKLRVASELPWMGKTKIEISPQGMRDVAFHFRIPSWSSRSTIKINGKETEMQVMKMNENPVERTASGYDPRESQYWSIKRTWAPGDILEIDFLMDILLRHAHPKVKGHQNKVAITRGPLVYCLEDVDHPDMDIFSEQVDTSTLSASYAHDLFGGSTVVTAESRRSLPLKFIPYHLWGNRGAAKMNVWVNEIRRGKHD